MTPASSPLAGVIAISGHEAGRGANTDLVRFTGWGRRRRGRRRPAVRVTTMLVAGLTVAAAGAGPVAAAPPDPLVEPRGFFSGIPYELAHPGGSLPGTNDWACRPTPAHPRPVILVHGQGGGRVTNWGAYGAVLANRGYCVYALTYGAVDGRWPLSALGGLGEIPGSAEQFGDFLDAVLAATGADSADVVGHSRGTYVPVYHLKTAGRPQRISTLVALAPLWNGSQTDPPRTGMRPGGDVHEVVWRGGSPYLPGVTHVNISTRYDEIVVPYTSGQVPGRRGEDVTNIVVQDHCPQDYSDHLAIAGSRRTVLMVLNALDPAHPVTVPCEPVPPFSG